MQYLYESKERATGRQIAEAIGSTVGFVPQVLNSLVQAGWIDSKRGPSGGYSLAADPRSVTILEVIEAIEGPIDDGRCVLVGGPCGTADVCSIHEAWREARFALRAAFAGIPVVEP